MDKTIYKFPEIVKIIEEQKYKFCALHDLTGEIVVPYNSLKKGASIKSKLAEIKTRSLRLPPGIYCVVCKSVYGTNSKGDKYYLGIGKYDPLALNDAPQIQTIKTEQRISKKDPEYLLSMDTALDNMRELAELKGENSRLKAENTKLKEEIADLEEELEEDPESLGSNSGGMGSLSDMFKNILPVIDPLAQKYFDLEEKKLNFQQAKFLNDNGYQIPGANKVNGSHKKSNGATLKDPEPEQVPDPGSERWENYIKVLLNMPEDTFTEHIAQLKQHDPKTYEAVCKEVFEEGEEPE